MALSSGNTLSLNALAGATGITQGTNVSLGAIEGSPTAGENISLGSFALGSTGVASVDSITGFLYAVENTNETYTLGFTGAGSRFSTKIGNRAANFTWSVAAGSTISLSSNNGSSAVFAVSNRTNAPTQTILQNISSNTIRVNFADGYNDHATGYGVNKDKTVYSVDSYDGNSAALCLVSDSPVTLADGSIIEIGDLTEGDVLKGYSLDGLTDDIHFFDWNQSSLNSSEVNVTVKNVVYSFANKIYNINNGELKCTAEHPFLVKDSSDTYRFLETHRLEVGDKLIKSTETGLEEISIVSIDIETNDVEIVSIDVEDIDTYLANGYITHNKGGNTHTDLGAPSAVGTLTFSNPNVSWTGISGASAYDVEVDNSSGFGSIDYSYSEWSTTSIRLGRGYNPATEPGPGNLALPAGTWYVRVRAIDHGLKGGWSPTLTLNA